MDVGPAVAAASFAPRLRPRDDAVDQPGVDRPILVAAGGPPDVDEEPFRGSNGPPPEFTPLQELFPGLKTAPGLIIPLAPIDGFLGFSATVDATDAAAARGTAPAHPCRSAERRPDLPDWIEVYRRPAAAAARA